MFHGAVDNFAAAVELLHDFVPAVVENLVVRKSHAHEHGGAAFAADSTDAVAKYHSSCSNRQNRLSRQ